MKMLNTSTILAATGALLLAASAQASGPIKQVVHSTNGQPVVSSFGDCVLTNFDNPMADCSAAVNLDIEMRTVYFNFNASSLTPAAKTKLNALAKALRSKKVKAVKIVGFADEIGADSYNVALSKRRANAVASYLRGKGISVKGKSEIHGLGATASQSDCEDVSGKELRSCLWRDRRVEVEIVN